MRPLTLAFMLIVLASQVRAQEIGRNVELVGTVAGLGGVTRLSSEPGSRTQLYGGARIDGGLQFATTSVGVGGRLWFLDEGEELLGGGLDVFLAASRRLNGGVHTSIRGTVGFSTENLDPASGTQGVRSTAEGLIWSAGVEHEFVACAWRLVVSADLLVPPSADPYGRKPPVLEFGLGLRKRGFQKIRPI